MIKTVCAKFCKQNHPNNTLLLTWAAFLSHFRPILHDLIYIIADLRAGIVSTATGGQITPRTSPTYCSSHGSAIPRRSSHFGDRGASLLGRRLRVRRLRKSQSAETLANLAFTNISSICLHTSKLQWCGGGAHVNDVWLFVVQHSRFSCYAWTVSVDTGRGAVGAFGNT